MMENNKAKEVSFTIFEVERMYRANREANADYEKKLLTMSAEERRNNSLTIPEKYHSLEHYLHTFMQDLADVSHGDIVVTGYGLTELRVQANYQQAKMYARITKEK